MPPGSTSPAHVRSSHQQGFRTKAMLQYLSPFCHPSFAFTPLLCICCKACHHTEASNTKALQHIPQLHIVTATCRRPAALAQNLCDCDAGTKPTLMQACHASQATLRSPLRCSFLTASAAPPAVRMAGGGGRCGLLLFTSQLNTKAMLLLRSVHPALLPMAAVHNSTLDYSHYRNEHRSAI